jgi:ribosome-binding protein aMBF1 (putative translation factor)
MSCELCGGGDEWIKTCLTPAGSRLLVCDPCYEEHASVLVIVPGDRTVTARCDHCWRYGNPREFAEVRLGGRKNAYSGICATCVEVTARARREEALAMHKNSEVRIGEGQRRFRSHEDV